MSYCIYEKELEKLMLVLFSVSYNNEATRVPPLRL